MVFRRRKGKGKSNGCGKRKLKRSGGVFPKEDLHRILTEDSSAVEREVERNYPSPLDEEDSPSASDDVAIDHLESGRRPVRKCRLSIVGGPSNPAVHANLVDGNDGSGERKSDECKVSVEGNENVNASQCLIVGSTPLLGSSEKNSLLVTHSNKIRECGKSNPYSSKTSQVVTPDVNDGVGGKSSIGNESGAFVEMSAKSCKLMKSEDRNEDSDLKGGKRDSRIKRELRVLITRTELPLNSSDRVLRVRGSGKLSKDTDDVGGSTKAVSAKPSAKKRGKRVSSLKSESSVESVENDDVESSDYEIKGRLSGKDKFSKEILDSQKITASSKGKTRKSMVKQSRRLSDTSDEANIFLTSVTTTTKRTRRIKSSTPEVSSSELSSADVMDTGTATFSDETDSPVPIAAGKSVLPTDDCHLVATDGSSSLDSDILSVDEEYVRGTVGGQRKSVCTPAKRRTALSRVVRLGSDTSDETLPQNEGFTKTVDTEKAQAVINRSVVGAEREKQKASPERLKSKATLRRNCRVKSSSPEVSSSEFMLVNLMHSGTSTSSIAGLHTSISRVDSLSQCDTSNVVGTSGVCIRSGPSSDNEECENLGTKAGNRLRYRIRSDSDSDKIANFSSNAVVSSEMRTRKGRSASANLRNDEPCSSVSTTSADAVLIQDLFQEKCLRNNNDINCADGLQNLLKIRETGVSIASKSTQTSFSTTGNDVLVREKSSQVSVGVQENIVMTSRETQTEMLSAEALGKNHLWNSEVFGGENLPKLMMLMLSQLKRANEPCVGSSSLAPQVLLDDSESCLQNDIPKSHPSQPSGGNNLSSTFIPKRKTKSPLLEIESGSESRDKLPGSERERSSPESSGTTLSSFLQGLDLVRKGSLNKMNKQTNVTKTSNLDPKINECNSVQSDFQCGEMDSGDISLKKPPQKTISLPKIRSSNTVDRTQDRRRLKCSVKNSDRVREDVNAVSVSNVHLLEEHGKNDSAVGVGSGKDSSCVPCKGSGKGDVCVRIDNSYKCLENGVSDMSSDGDVRVVWSTKSGKAPKKIQRSRVNKVFDSCPNDNMIEIIKEVKSPVNQPVPENVGGNTPQLYSSLVEKESKIAGTNNPNCDPSKTSEGHTLRTKRFLKIKRESSSLAVEDGSGSKSCPIDSSIEVIKVVKSPESTHIPEGDGEVTPELKSVLVEKGSETVKTNISKSDPSKPSGGHDLRAKHSLKRKKESSSLAVEDGSGSKSCPIDSSIEVIKVVKSPESTPIPEGDGEVTPELKSVLVEKGSETVKTNISKSDPSKPSGGHDLRAKHSLKRKKESSSLAVEDESESKSCPIDSSIEVIKVVKSPDSTPIPEGDGKVIRELKSGQVAKESEKVRTNIPKSDSCRKAGGHNLRTKLFPNRKIESSFLAVGDESESKSCPIDRSIEVIKVLKSPVSQPTPKADDSKSPRPNLDPVEKDNEIPLPRPCRNISDVTTVHEKRKRRSVGKDRFMPNSGPTPLKKVRKGPESTTLSLPKSICDVKEVGPSAVNDDINEALKLEEDDQDSVGDDADSDVISIYGESDYDQLLSGMGSQCPEVTFDTIEEDNSSSCTLQDEIPVSRISSNVPSPIIDKVAENEPEIPESGQHASLLGNDIPSKTSDPTLEDSAPAGDVRLSPDNVTAAEEVHPINDTGSLPGKQASRADQGGTHYPADTGSLPVKQATRMDQGGTPAEDVQSIVSGSFIDSNTSDGANSCDLRIVAYHDVDVSTPSPVPAAERTYKFKPPAAIRKIRAKADTALRNGNTIFKGMCFLYLRKGECSCKRFKHEFRPHVLQLLEKMDSWDIFVSLQYSLRREFIHFWDEFGIGILNLLVSRGEGKYLYGVLFVYCCTKLVTKRWFEVLKCIETHETDDEHCVVQILIYFIINHLHKKRNFCEDENRSTYNELVDKVTSISCNFRSTIFLKNVLEVLIRQEFWFSKHTFEQLLQRCVDEASTDAGMELCFIFAKFIVRLGSLSRAESYVISLLQELIKILEKNNEDLLASKIRAQILDDIVPKSTIEGGNYSVEGPSESGPCVTSMEEQGSGALENVQMNMEWPNSNYPRNQPPIMPLLPNFIPKSVNPYCGVAEFSVAEVSTSVLSRTQSVYKPNSGAMPLQRRDVLCDNFGMSSKSVPSSSMSAGVNRMGRSESFGQSASNPSVLPPVNSLGRSCGELDTKGQVKIPSSLDDEKDQDAIFSEEEDKGNDHFEEIQSYQVQQSGKQPTERSSQPLTYSEVFKQKYKIPLLPTPDSVHCCPSSSLTLEEVVKKRKWTPVLMFKFFNPCLGSAEKQKDFVFQVVSLLEKDMTAAFPVMVAMVNCLASKEFMETSNCNKRMWIKKVVTTMVLNVMLKMIFCDMWSEGYKLMNLANDASLPLLEAETYLMVMSTTGKILFLSEICFRCDQMKEALHLLKTGNLFCQIPSQWKYDSCDSDFETRVTILTSLICKMALGGYSDLAPMTYLDIYRSQKGVSESVDLLVHANKVIVCAINAGYYNLAYEVYETVPDDEPVLPFLTLRALLCGMVCEDIKGLAKPIFKKMCEYGIYPLMKENELVTEIVIKSFWLKEEIFMVLSSVLQIWGPILLVHQPTKHKEPGFCVSLLLKKFPDLDNQEAVLKLDEESEKDPVPYYLMLPSNSVEHVLGEVLYVLENMLVPPIKHTVFTVDDGAAKRVVFNRMSLINHLVNAEVKSEVDG